MNSSKISVTCFCRKVIIINDSNQKLIFCVITKNCLFRNKHKNYIKRNLRSKVVRKKVKSLVCFNVLLQVQFFKINF